MPIPETAQQYHHHDGDDYPVVPVRAYLQEPSEASQWVELGAWCPYCGFTETPVAVRMHLEVMMGWKQAEEVEPSELVDD